MPSTNQPSQTAREWAAELRHLDDVLAHQTGDLRRQLAKLIVLAETEGAESPPITRDYLLSFSHLSSTLGCLPIFPATTCQPWESVAGKMPTENTTGGLSRPRPPTLAPTVFTDHDRSRSEIV